jgi:hypothetical protein
MKLNMAMEASLHGATFASLTFTTQKNGVRGKVIGLARSGALHLRNHAAPATTPLATYFENAAWHPIRPAAITSVLQVATAILGPSVGFLPDSISARSLRAAGAMALLCAQVDTDVIRFIGRWRSDKMLRYLHVQAKPAMCHIVSRMLSHGSFVLHPGHHKVAMF